MDFLISKTRDKVFEDNPKKDYYGFLNPFTLDDVAKLTKELKTKVTLVSTGMKCQLDSNQYLELSVRSSTPLKHWLIMGNGVGIIDSDYYNNESNEGEIYFQVVNLFPFAISLKRGDRIGQGIIRTYETVDNDIAGGERTGGFGSTNE
jgi:dUTP pyrophosphatase